MPPYQNNFIREKECLAYSPKSIKVDQKSRNWLPETSFDGTWDSHVSNKQCERQHLAVGPLPDRLTILKRRGIWSHVRKGTSTPRFFKIYGDETDLNNLFSPLTGANKNTGNRKDREHCKRIWQNVTKAEKRRNRFDVQRDRIETTL